MQLVDMPKTIFTLIAVRREQKAYRVLTVNGIYIVMSDNDQDDGNNDYVKVANINEIQSSQMKEFVLDMITFEYLV
jgi:ribosomal protein S4E